MKIKYNNWRIPSRSELENEFITEYSFSDLIEIKNPPPNIYNKFKDIIINNINEFSSIETIYISELAPELDIYNKNLELNIQELHVLLKNYNKDVNALTENFLNNRPLPAPLFLKNLDGSIKILGGRTRTTIAKMLNFNSIQVLFIDEKKLKDFLKPFWRTELIENNLFCSFAELIDEVRPDLDPENKNHNLLARPFLRDYKKYILGIKKSFPEIPDLKEYNFLIKIKDLKKEGEELRKKLN